MITSKMRFGSIALVFVLACDSRSGPATDDDGAGWRELEHDGERIFVPVDSRSPDSTISHVGRDDVQFPDVRTAVGIELSGLGAWQSGDTLQLVAPEVGLTYAGFETALERTPTAGSTRISGQTVDWQAALAPLVDAARGDTTWVVQLRDTTSDAGTHYSAIAAAGQARGFTVRTGQPARLGATLAPVTADRRLALRWRGREFAALASQAGPGASPAAAPAISIKALPAAAAADNAQFATYYNGLPSLVELGPIDGAGDVDQKIAYGDPFTSAAAPWTELVTVVYASSVPIPTAHGVGALPAMMVAALPVDALGDAGVIAPVVTPVRNVRINGQALDAARTGVGLAPAIAWDAPARGAVTGYAITVHAVDASTGGVSVRKLATLYAGATTTSIVLPDSVLAAGGTYVAAITAIAAPGADFTHRPFGGAASYAAADHVTAPFAP